MLQESHSAAKPSPPSSRCVAFRYFRWACRVSWTVAVGEVRRVTTTEPTALAPPRVETLPGRAALVSRRAPWVHHQPEGGAAPPPNWASGCCRSLGTKGDMGTAEQGLALRGVAEPPAGESASPSFLPAKPTMTLAATLLPFLSWWAIRRGSMVMLRTLVFVLGPLRFASLALAPLSPAACEPRHALSNASHSDPGGKEQATFDGAAAASFTATSTAKASVFLLAA